MDIATGTHGKTYKTKCEEEGVTMYPGVEPTQYPTTQGQKNAQIMSFMRAKPSKWTKEGLLEHIIELIVVEEKVCVQISKSLSYLNLMIIPVF